MGAANELVARVLETRRATMRLTESLATEDWIAQSMPDASPVKWHLAHTTWFFERFVLRDLGIEPVNEAYEFLFNSYYDSVGDRHPRDKRGLLTRPTVAETIAYRHAIDARLADLEGDRLDRVAAALELGRHHEQQHQELLVTDLKHLFAQNPLLPVFRPEEHESVSAPALSWRRFDGGVFSIGSEEGFAFDNELPRHRVFLTPYELASRLVTWDEYRAFIADRGYSRPELWLSEGWAWVNANRITAPLYTYAQEEIFTLSGKRKIDGSEPVCHVTYYEADAYARWAGARLPREAEWEVAADHSKKPEGSFAEDNRFHPRTATGSGFAQLLGDAWEWTSSAYSPYPGFAPLAGAFGEYNGKFMVSQMVLRGGSCATPRSHIRATYRNFFPPSAAWQFTGIRLARDAT